MIEHALAADNELGYLLLNIAASKFGARPVELTPAQREESLRIARRQALIERRVLASPEAAAAVVPAQAVTAAVAQIRARYGDEAEFQRELTANHLDEERLAAALARELRVDAVMAAVAARAPTVDDTEARLFYYLHPARFQQEETREARHILITINPQYVENRRDTAFARAREIAQRLARKPDRFAEQALKHSECPTALQGGQLGRVKRGTLYADLDAKLFALRENTVSDVIESPIGFHVLLCEKIYPACIAPLHSVLPKLREQLTTREAGRAQKRWLERLLAAESVAL